MKVEFERDAAVLGFRVKANVGPRAAGLDSVQVCTFGYHALSWLFHAPQAPFLPCCLTLMAQIITTQQEASSIYSDDEENSTVVSKSPSKIVGFYAYVDVSARFDGVSG